MAEEEAIASSYCHRMTFAYIQYLPEMLDLLIRNIVHLLGGIKMTAENEGLP